MAHQALTEPAFFILAALLDEPRHGYGIVGEVAELSSGRVRLKVGTLYGVLDRLVADQLIELDREEVAQGRLRRYFRLTDGGADALVAETERQAANVQAASERLRAWRPAGGERRASGGRPASAGGLA
ncbi:MAG TPA: PadR family transcriptional regulator [Mycobacteriales bacterium]|nr:PadR family transcriptional regulator [Mycobacteriales bacterium]